MPRRALGDVAWVDERVGAEAPRESKRAVVGRTQHPVEVAHVGVGSKHRVWHGRRGDGVLTGQRPTAEREAGIEVGSEGREEDHVSSPRRDRSASHLSRGCFGGVTRMAG